MGSDASHFAKDAEPEWGDFAADAVGGLAARSPRPDHCPTTVEPPGSPSGSSRQGGRRQPLAAAASGSSASPGAGPKFAAACEEFFCRFDRNKDGLLSLEELRALAEAVCDVWQVAAPDAADLAAAFERHRSACDGAFLAREGFTECAGELLSRMLERHPGLAVPGAAEVLAARGRAAARALLHSALPTGTRSLHSMGAGGVAVVLSEVRGLPAAAAAGPEGGLAREEHLCCLVVVRRRGRLLPRKATRLTALAGRGTLGPGGQPVWRFNEELVFDEPALLARRGELSCSIFVRRSRGLLPCALAVARDVPLPTAGTAVARLVDPATGGGEGEVQLCAGWQCSARLASYVAEDLRSLARAGRWEEARRALQQNGAEAAERVAASADSSGRTLLMWAARCGEGTPLVRDLLALRTPAWLAADAHGATAAHYAALSGSLEALAALLGSGLPADAPAPGLRGATPLMLAALRGAADHVRLLLGHGARADRPDALGLPAAAWGLGRRAALGPGAAPAAVGSAVAEEAARRWVQANTPPEPAGGSCCREGENGGSEVEAWGCERLETLELLVEELWCRAPPSEDPDQPDEAEEAFALLWLPLAERAAEAAPSPVFRQVLCTDLRRRCGSRQRYRRLLAALFSRALGRRHEPLAVRLVAELGVLGPEACTSSSNEDEKDTDRPLDAPAKAPPPAPLPAAPAPAAAAAASVRAALEAAVEAGMCRLACALLGPAGAGAQDGRPCLGPPSSAVRTLRLATERGDGELVRAVLQRMPMELPRDAWEEPAVLFSHTACECPVCFQTLSDRPVALCGPSPPDLPACPHLVCRPCGERLGGRCPLCRASFSEARPLPDPSEDPIAWFHFAASCEGQPPASGFSSSSTAPAQAASSGARLSRAGLERVLPATLPVEPRVLEAALSAGLWSEWDTDHDGWISKKDFFEPFHGLLRWLLVHLHELKALARAGEPPELETDREGWFQHAVSAGRSAATGEGLTKGDALCALLRLSGVTSLDRPAVERCRGALSERWSQWDPRELGLVAKEDFLRRGGLADFLLQESSQSCAHRALQKLRAASARGEPGGQVKALAELCRSSAGLGAAPSSPSGGGQGRSAASGALGATCAAWSARRLRAAEGAEGALYAEAWPLVISAVDGHSQHPQVLRWASRALAVLALSLSERVAEVPLEEASWPLLVRAALGSAASASELGARLAERLGGHLGPAKRLARAMGALCALPGAAAERSFRETLASVLLLVRLLIADEPEEALRELLGELQVERRAAPALHAFACLLACAVAGDASGILSRLESWGHQCPAPWTPPCALPSTAVSLGQQVEVCCQGGWQRGVVARAPAAEPSQPRDECWVVACAGESRTYSRHVWAPGWAAEASLALQRLRLGLLAFAGSPRRPLAGGSATRRALLDAVIVRSLGPKALEPLPVLSGPVLRGAPGGVQVRVGDKVWMGVALERARQLQTQRHGDWSDQMSFCLDCPGRVLEVLAGPPRVRVSHGSLGVFLWNPAAITRSEATAEPLPFEEGYGPLVVGDEVLLVAEQAKVVPLQVGHGGWSARMSHCLGRHSRVVGFHNRGDVRVDTPGCGAFLWNPAAIEPPGGGSAACLCAQAVSRFDEEGAAMLLLLALARLADVDEGAEAAVEEVLEALARVGGGQQGAPTRLRAFGALALLAATMDLGQALQAASTSSSSAPMPEGQPWAPLELEASLPSCCAPRALEALARSPAMQWPASDTGGISFAEVVEGRASAAAAASRWLVAFFDARHPRLLDAARAAESGRG